MPSDKKNETAQLRQFGILMGVILGALTLYQWFVHERWWEWVVGIGAFFLIIGIVYPKALTPVYRPWMWLAEKIGFVMNRVILTLFYLLFLTPIAWVRRLFNRDPLSLKWDKQRQSYFEPKPIQPPEQFENLF